MYPKVKVGVNACAYLPVSPPRAVAKRGRLDFKGGGVVAGKSQFGSVLVTGLGQAAERVGQVASGCVELH